MIARITAKFSIHCAPPRSRMTMVIHRTGPSSVMVPRANPIVQKAQANVVHQRIRPRSLRRVRALLVIASTQRGFHAGVDDKMSPRNRFAHGVDGGRARGRQEGETQPDAHASCHHSVNFHLSPVWPPARQASSKRATNIVFRDCVVADTG